MEDEMQVALTRWGNSLGMRIPRELAARFQLAEGAHVDVAAEGDRIVITMPAMTYSLSEMLVGIKPGDFSEAFDWGPDVGRERVE